MAEIVTAKIYDLHAHSDASDGLLSPQQLVERAVERGVSVISITDHDSIAGLADAQRVIEDKQLALSLISGVEISTLWENHEIHIVGLGFDPKHSAIESLLAQQHLKRQQRATMIGERLAKVGIANALDGARYHAGAGIITRAHFARYIIEIGRAETIHQVFKYYLARGKTGYVPPQWCGIEEAVSAIHQAGGRAVIAHPSRYQLSAKWLKRLLKYFTEVGGDAIEVAQCQQAPDERRQLAEYSRQFGLAASQGSDFHQPCAWIELGRKLWLPKDVVPVWQRFPEIERFVIQTDRRDL